MRSFKRPLFLPFAFVLVVIHFFQIGIRGGSRELEVFLVVAAIAALLLGVGVAHWGRLVLQRTHPIVSTTIVCMAFFVFWCLTTFVAEEAYIHFDGYEDRRIYTDDSGMGYAMGVGGLAAATAVSSLFGLGFGFLWGTFLWLVSVISGSRQRKKGAS